MAEAGPAGRRRMDDDLGPLRSPPFVARMARWGLVVWSIIGLLILVGLIYRYVLYPVRVIFPPLVVALIVINLLDPVVSRFERGGVARIWASLLTYVVFLSLLVVALSWLIPVLSRQAGDFVSGVPNLLARAQQGLAAWTRRVGLPTDAGQLISPFEPGTGGAFSFLQRITSFTVGVVHVAVVLVLGLLLAFYLLVDMPKIRTGARALVPAQRREEAAAVAERIGATIGGFFRGQLLVAVLVGVASMLGFWAIGLPYFALLGAITGLFALVPMIGAILAAVPAAFVGATTTGPTGGVLGLAGGWQLSLGGVVVLLLAQQLDARLLSPRLLRRSVRLHPITVLLSLVLGGAVLGVWGMLLAVPTAAVVKVVGLHMWDSRSSWPPRSERGAPRDQRRAVTRERQPTGPAV